MTNANESSLHVKPGCATPVALAGSPRVSKRERKLSSAAYVEGILKGDRSVLARAITLIESSLTEDRQIADEVLAKCLPASGKVYSSGSDRNPRCRQEQPD